MTDAILNAIVSTLKTHSWSSTAPADVVKGPIPPSLEYPMVGVLAVSGDVNDESLSGMDVEERYEITILHPLSIDSASATLEKLLGMRDEIFQVVGGNPTWGLAGVDSTMIAGWDSSYLAEESGMGWLQSLTVKLDVRYRTDL